MLNKEIFQIINEGYQLRQMNYKSFGENDNQIKFSTRLWILIIFLETVFLVQTHMLII